MVSFHRSYCEADFPMLPDGGLDLKFVKLWWGIGDFKVRSASMLWSLVVALQLVASSAL